MKFTDILRQLNIEFKPSGHHHCRPGWIQLDCPFCGKDTHNWHMGYSLAGHYLNCWRCGSHRPIETLVEATGLSFNECRVLLDEVTLAVVKKEKVKGKLIVPKGVGNLKLPHARYLIERGFLPGDIVKLWKIHGIVISANLFWRIYIPIIYHGQTVSWTTRSISNDKRTTRYISASLKEESRPRVELLYGEDFARQSIVVQEGPLDAWRIGPGAVATLGTGYSNAQLFRMAQYKKRVICFDNEKEAQARARKLCDDLSVYPGVTYNVQLDAKDSAAASVKEVRRLRKLAGIL